MLIRTAQLIDANEIAKISVNGWRAAYTNIIPEDYLANISYEDRLQKWCQVLEEIKAGDASRIAFVAENNQQQIVGYICGGKSREAAMSFDAELYAIYVDPEQKQNGIGSRLVEAFVKWLIGQGYHSMFCRVLEKNPARKFYEKLGGQLVSEKIAKAFNGKLLIEIAYAWPELKLCINQN